MIILKIFWKIWFGIFGTMVFAPLFVIMLVLDITETKEKRKEDWKRLSYSYLESMNAFDG